MKITRKRRVMTSRRLYNQNITASAKSYDEMIQKIQYYAKKIIADIYEAAEIIGNHQFVNIPVPEIYVDDYVDPDLFFDWYVTAYIDNFDSNHPGGELEEIRGYRGAVEYNVSYGVLSGSELEDTTEQTPRGGSNVEMNAQALMSVV